MPNPFKESAHFSAFTEILYGSPIAEWDKAESPDFIFRENDKVIGVEHTQIFLDGSNDLKLVAIESIGNDIARRVQLKGLSLHYNFQAVLQLNISDSLNEKERESIASEIYEKIENTIRNTNILETQYFVVSQVNSVVRRIRFVATQQELATRVTVARAGWVKRTIAEEIVEAITNKNFKAKDYASKCDELWLLIVADGHDPSSLFDIQPPVISVSCCSHFDRVYYFDFFKKSLSMITVHDL